MIAGMAPVRRPGVFHFCSTGDPALIARAMPWAIATFAEDEGLSLILPQDAAVDLGFACDTPMACVTLSVLSALEGVGLTAAVATTLARAGIACNMVAAFHHDHAFVPLADGERALALLLARAGAARSDPAK
jgi:hypothetical protein